MDDPTHEFPPDLGKRLKEERKRCGLTQSELADLAGIGRLAQYQYESEARSPNTRYLNAIFAAGLDISYILLGTRHTPSFLTMQDMQEIETKALSLLAKTENETGTFSDDKRFVLYQLIRSRLIDQRISDQELPGSKSINA